MASTQAVGDRDNFSGDLDLTAPTGGVTKGSIYTIEGSQVVARETAAAAATFLAAVDGPVVVTKATGTGETLAAGDVVYAASNAATPTATGGTRIGIALEAADTSTAKVLVLLQPGVAS